MSHLDLTRAPQTDPLSLYRYRDGLYAVDLLTAAIVWLDFFTWLERNPSDLPGICRQLELKERPADVMLSLFATNQLVTKDATGVFRNTTLAKEFLIEGSPWNVKPYYASLKERPVCKDFLTVLRTGKPANWGGYKDAQDWHKAMETPGFAQSFTAAMDCRGIYLGQALAKALDLRGRKRLLDVAGGSGIYACALAAANTDLQATVFDKAPVDRIAAQLIQERGFTDRVSVAAGDMFTDAWPAACDVHLISNVIHDWDVAEAKKILARSAEALPKGGLLAIHDMHLNREKTGPKEVIEYSCILMHSTEGRCYSVGELETWLSELGFGKFNLVPTAADRTVLTAEKLT